MEYQDLIFRDQADTAIQNALKQTVEFFKADRGYIFSFDLPADTITNTYEFCVPGISRQIDKLQNIPLPFISDWIQSLAKEEAVIVTDLVTLPVGPFRESLEVQQIKNLLLVPLTGKNGCKGFLGFDYVKELRSFSTVEAQQLALFASLLNNLNDRIGMENLLREKQIRLNAVIDGTRAGTWEWNIQTGKTVFNNHWAKMLGYELAELEPVSITTWRNLTHPDDLVKAEKSLQQHFSGNSDFYSIDLRMRHKKGHWVWVQDTGKVYEWTAEGLPLLAAGTHQDISLKKRRQKTLIQHVMKYRSLFDHALEGLFLHDLDGKFIKVNKAALVQTGYSRKELLGMTVFDLNKSLPSPDALLASWAALKEGEVITTETEYHHRDGYFYQVELKALRIYNDHDPAILAHVRDVSLHKSAEAKLIAQERFYRQAFDAIPALVFITRPDGYSEFQNQYWERYTGIPYLKQTGDNWNKLLHPDDQERVLRSWYEAVADNIPYDLEYRVRRQNNTYEWFSVTAQPIRDENGQILQWFGVGLNIDRFKKTVDALAEREKILTTIANNVSDKIIMLDRDHRAVFLNASAIETLREAKGQPELGWEGCDGQRIVDLLYDHNMANMFFEADERVMAKGIEDTTEHELIVPGRSLFLQISRVPLCNKDGQVTGLIGIARDITVLKKADEQRLAQLERQRDELVREVHHRIKNHLQGVTGILRNSISDNPALASPLEAAIRQISSIADVYGVGALSGNKPIQLMDLIHSIIAGFPKSPEIKFNTEVDQWQIALRTEDAVPTALIINELLTNAIKHLHHIDPDRPVQVCVKDFGNNLCLEITSGPACLPVDFDFNIIGTLGTGLELVKALLPTKGAQLTYEQRGDEVSVVYCFENNHAV